MTNEELWVSERPKLEALLRRRLPRDVVEDVVDEAFARLKGKPANVSQLWGIAFNVELEHYATEAAEEFKVEQAGLLTGFSIETIETAILRADLTAAFRCLPREQWVVFALTELRGLTNREAAAVLGLAHSTVWRRCELARANLVKELS